MRFEQDVYSLCESVYYSCNNDEYDYVLECVNNWIYNDYNDNILLETVMAAPIIVSRTHSRDFHTMATPHDNELGYFPIAAIPQSANIDDEFFKKFESAKGRGDDYTTSVRHFSSNGRHFVGRYVLFPEFISKLPPDLAQAFSNKTNGGVDNKGRAVRGFIGWEYKPNKNGEIPKPMDDITMARIYLHQLKDTDYNSTTNTSHKTQFSSVQSVKSSMPLVNFDTHTVDKRGNVIERQIAPPPPPSQQETQPNTPPKQDKPIVISNDNNQSRLSRATTWMKNNKGKTALGVGLGAAAIGGSIYAYKQYKNRPKSVIAKRIQALRDIYHKFMINAQRNPKKANLFKRIAAKILSVIDKLLHYLQNKADGR